MTANKKLPTPSKPVPETVILECQHWVYRLIDEAAAKKALVEAARKKLTDAERDYAYNIRQVQEVIDFLESQADEESGDTRAEYEAAAAHKGLDVKKREKDDANG